ncbi:MAG: hypothetical protein M1826_005548 [Phylliscum demangeonii]|nr:MAG: hypothetical protein M1826_005548 [Phylliscum demangeonii]
MAGSEPRRSSSVASLAQAASGLKEMLRRNWYLGLTSFGGPAVHFQTFRKLFVEKYGWIDQQTYQELFALCSALPGPGSTKMLYAINFARHGFGTGLLAFFLWSLPTAFAAYGLARGVAHLHRSLPTLVYALLSGLNAATVGIILLAAVQLSQKAISDRITRLLVFFGAAAGVMYNALWYFPVLMVVGGATTVVWDYGWAHALVHRVRTTFARPRRRRRRPSSEDDVETGPPVVVPLAAVVVREPETEEKDPSSNGPHPPTSARIGGVTGVADVKDVLPNQTPAADADPAAPHADADTVVEAPARARRPSLPLPLPHYLMSWTTAAVILICFLAVFVLVMVLRGVLRAPPRGFSVFANLFLAGTIIFGGGPVVIPLLREYVVAQGWVTPRDFLLGLAIMQAFPGPNFNFAVYLGALALPHNPLLGSVAAYIAIFTPGLTLHTATMGIWTRLRAHHPRWRRAMVAVLRGINAAAVGLIWTAVYRLWQVGFLTAGGGDGGGRPLSDDPWWVVVTAASFTAGMWFRVPAPVAIVAGGVAGLVWSGVRAAQGLV